MMKEEHTFRFSCDGTRGKRKASCPNTMRLTGIVSEIEKYYQQSGWSTIEVYGTTKHICPRKHDSEDESDLVSEKRIGLFGGIPVYENGP